MTALAVLALLAWLYLALLHGRFWQPGPLLPPDSAGGVRSGRGRGPGA